VATRIDIISAVPDLFEGVFSNSIVGNATENDLAEIHIHDLRDYSMNRHHKIDDYPYGGGGGMVLTPQPIFSCIEKLKNERTYNEIIYTTPAGKPFSQQKANKLSLATNIIILCGHYKGVDQRVRDELITCEISMGDFVLSGGEIPAMAITDAIIRLIPGVLGDAESALSDSFQDDELLEGPKYTRPAKFKNMEVPEVLRSGDHRRIKHWKHRQSEKITQQRRPDLFKNYKDKQQKELPAEVNNG